MSGQHSQRATGGRNTGTMQSAARIAVSVFLLTSALASAYQNSAKLRRDGVLNLYPFPRVGRSSHQTWQVPLNDFYLEYKPSEKRQLYAFPRVGRSDLSLYRAEPFHSEQFRQIPLQLEELLFGRARSHAYAKRESESTDSTGMWFGPRLGRSFKSDEDVIQIENNEHSEPEQIDPEHNDDRQKRQIKQN